MKVFEGHNEPGELIYFEVSNTFLSRQGAVDVIAAIPDVKILTHSFEDDAFCTFRLGTRVFELWEPFGDNSRYHIGEPEAQYSEELEIVKRAFAEHKRWPFLGKMKRILMRCSAFIAVAVTFPALAHEYPDGDICPHLCRTNGTIVVRFQRWQDGKYQAHFQAQLTEDGTLGKERRVNRPPDVYPPRSGRAALPGHWIWREGNWYTIDPRSNNPATLCTLQSNRVDTVRLSAKDASFAPGLDPFVLTKDHALMIGYTTRNTGNDEFVAPLKEKAFLYFFALDSGKLTKKVELGRHEYRGAFDTLLQAGFIFHGGKYHLPWVRRGKTRTALTLMLAVIDPATLAVTHREIREYRCDNSAMSALLHNDALYIAVHAQESEESQAKIEVLKVDLK